MYKLKTVVIDAGHGGKLPGTHGIYVAEKEITLKLALKLGKLIEENVPDVKVIYTRTTDVHIGLMERATIANENNADLFIWSTGKMQAFKVFSSNLCSFLIAGISYSFLLVG